MDTAKRVRVNSPASYIVCTILLVLLEVLYYFEVIPHKELDMILVCVAALLILPDTIWQCIHAVYFTEKGIIFCRFGRDIYSLPWRQISQICIARMFRWSSGPGINRTILVVPQDCEQYDKDKWSGVCYHFMFRKQVLMVDYTKENCQFIEQYYGTIIDQT